MGRDRKAGLRAGNLLHLSRGGNVPSFRWCCMALYGADTITDKGASTIRMITDCCCETGTPVGTICREMASSGYPLVALGDKIAESG